MASSPRDADREEERRLNMRTLTIASAASAAAAAVTSQLWIAGTWIAAALTPVLVALISEALHRPTERVARVSRAWTSERSALGGRAPEEPLPEAAGASPPPRPESSRDRRPPDADPLPRRAAPEPGPLGGEPGPVRVYRGGGARPSRRKIAVGVVAATAALAFVIGIVALTTVDLVSGGSVGKGSGRTTLLGGGKSGDNGAGRQQETAPADGTEDGGGRPDDQQTQPETQEPAPEEPAPEEPTDTAPLPETPAPGEPAPEVAP
jgi:hypothetical protein